MVRDIAPIVMPKCIKTPVLMPFWEFPRDFRGQRERGSLCCLKYIFATLSLLVILLAEIIGPAKQFVEPTLDVILGHRIDIGVNIEVL